MKTLYILLLLLSSTAIAAETDTYGVDKNYHAGVSLLLCAASGTLIENKYAAFGVAMASGLIKEIIDSRQHNNIFSKGDLLADAVGASLGVWLGNTYIRPSKYGIEIRTMF